MKRQILKGQDEEQFREQRGQVSMRCWVFDWQTTEQLHPMMYPPGRRWVMDDPDGSNSVLLHSPQRGNTYVIEFLLGSEAVHDEKAVLEAIDRRFPGATVVRVTRSPGEQHPRMWRGRWYRLPGSEIESLTGAVNSAQLLIGRFRQVALTVEPDKANRSAFGHELRHLLILAATEVESAWKAILIANNFPPPANDRYTTQHYSAIIDPLRLKEWKVVLSMYPAYGPIMPFDTWDRARPTASLPWYAAYNATKHDRETNLRKATLESVIAALAGLYVMLAAQFGPAPLGHGRAGVGSKYSIPEFDVQTEPQWGLTQEYVPADYSKIGVTVKLVPLNP